MSPLGAAGMSILFSNQKRDKYDVKCPKKEFLKGPALKALQQTHIFSDGIQMREGYEDSQQLIDLDDANGIHACKSYLCCIENLMSSLGIVPSNREYRETFTHSYKVLYG